MPPPDSHPMNAVYTPLWQEAFPLLQAGRITPDTRRLQPRIADTRRGLTLVARFNPLLTENINAFTDAVREVEPDQYFYQPHQRHLTMLSLFTAVENYAPFFAREAAYRSVVHSVLAHTAPFTLSFHGVTATQTTVMLQGYDENNTLQVLRDALRTALSEAELGADVDARYKLRTAHASLVRFAAPLRDPARLVDVLAAYRNHDFGAMQVSHLELVAHDWYLTPSCTTVWETYGLSSAASAA